MNYIIYTYFLISAFICGYTFNDLINEYKHHFLPFTIILVLCFYPIYIVLLFTFEFLKAFIIKLDDDYLYFRVRYQLRFTKKLDKLPLRNKNAIEKSIETRKNKNKQTLKDKLYIKYGTKVLERNISQKPNNNKL